MIKQSTEWQRLVWKSLSCLFPIQKTLRSIWRSRRIWLTASAVTGILFVVRANGTLQTWELEMLDGFFRARPAETVDDRIVIVGMDEEDLTSLGWPLPDDRLAQLLQRVRNAKARAVGLDIYRDLPVGTGNTALLETYRSMHNLVGIEQLRDLEGEQVAASPELKKLGQVGFNNIIYDSDRKVRRTLLYWTANGKTYQSFSLKLALLHLKAEGIDAETANTKPRSLKLGRAIFSPLDATAGVYAQADAGGYQIFANYRGGKGHFKTVTMRQVLKGEVSPQLFRDRIVLIGSTATSLKDVSATPFSPPRQHKSGLVAGVEIQANFISQIISAAQDDRLLLRSGSDSIEWLWIGGWALVGAGVCWWLYAPSRSVGAIALLSVATVGIGFGAFLLGWIIPVVPSLLALVGSSVVVIGFIAHSEEELKRSKEFLHRVINSIPDPVFVKDQHHRWIVLNEAYSNFLGKPIDELVEKSDHDVFPQHEADVFWQQDELVFQQEHEIEHEEQFTNTQGMTYQIATKRSLHQDSAGNLFLVGVIRDITQRKKMEEELRQRTIELSRSNEELRQSQDRLHHLANHDTLTGLPNRKLLYERLNQCLELARVNSQLVAVLFLDLDGFKQINDTLGHGVGDLLLQAVARRLTGCLRTSDTVARLGGDEFVILLPAIPDLQNAITVAGKVLATLAKEFAISGETLKVTTSVGIGAFPTHAKSFEDLIECADEAMYVAKKSGKNQYAIAQPTIVS